jgi:hypothetical protein
MAIQLCYSSVLRLLQTNKSVVPSNSYQILKNLDFSCTEHDWLIDLLFLAHYTLIEWNLITSTS